MSERRHDLAATEVDRWGNPRHLVVVEDPTPIQRTATAIEPLHIPDTTPRVHAEVSGSFESRGREFRHKTFPLAGVCAICAVTVMAFVKGWLAPVLVLTFFVVFAVVYLVSFAIHTAISIEGVELFNVLLTHWHIHRAESAQLERYRRETKRWH